MHFKLVCPGSSEVWRLPANEGFEQTAIVARLDDLQALGHTYEVIDGDAISDEERTWL